ncbi:MAG: DUF5696 domain-containing protein, partial [Candidatus Izemoplasmatales bacterium]
MNKKLLISFLVSLLLITFFSIIVKAQELNLKTNDVYQSSYTISTDSNFFGQPENTDKVSLPEDYLAELMVKGFKFVAETDDLELYIKESYFNLAIYDKSSGYLWYSINPNYLKYMLSGTSRFFVESGVIIEYYNMDNISIDNNRSYLSGPKYNVEKEYEYFDDGLTAHIEFEDLGISFDVEVKISEDKLSVKLPIDTLKEEDVEETKLNLDGTTYQKITKYRLKSVFLFPYFGSNNYEINGYSMIPDGSGALIRYSEERSSTAYIKRIYGADEGVSRYKEESSAYYIREELTASMPIFGVNHGYEQASFLAVVSEGDGYSEIHSYPYGYNAYPFNTTFAKFVVRDRYIIQTSSNSNDSFQLINENPYPSDFQVDYYFLSNEEASYSGMAKKYREILGINKTSSGVSTNISLLGMDFKNGLFGRDYVEMTTYNDAVMIVDDLLNSGIENLSLVYQGWNKSGYYGSTPINVNAASNLGGKSDFIEMMNHFNSLGIDTYFLDNPMLTYQQGLGKQIIRKTTLSVFETNEGMTSLFRSSFYMNPENISNLILRNEKKYDDLYIDGLALQTVGNALFTYRYGSNDYFRNDMIESLQVELNELSGFKLSLYQPNSYLWKYLDSYMFAPIESNKYAYVTDSIPFIQLVLAGSVDLNSTYINYISDYDLLALRLVEYGINPSFL